MTATDLDLDALLDALAARAKARAVDRPLHNQAGDDIGLLATTGRLVVNPGDVIASTWGNTTYDQTVQAYTSAADRDSQWPTPKDGAAAYTADTGTLWVRRAGAWVSVSGTPAPVASGGLVTYTDGTGEVWVAKPAVNGGAYRKARDVLAARYFRSGAWNLPTTTSPLGINAALGDAYGLYNGGTGVFTAPIAGLYSHHFSLGANGTSGQWMQVILQASGGSLLAMGIAHASATSIMAASCSLLIVHAAGDTVTTANVAASALPGRAAADTSRYHVDYLGTG